MCVKSKTSYGCGHRYKRTDYCDDPNCQSIDRWKFPANKDCPECKAAGEAATRGKEGRGRHGLRTRECRQDSSDSYSTPTSPSIAGSPRLSISPWAANDRSATQKKWDTPTRQKADAAWLVEHERRMSDLEETTSKMSLDLKHPYVNSAVTSARSSYEQIIEADEVEEPLDMDDPPPQPKAIKMLPYEVAEESEPSPSRRRSKKTEPQPHKTREPLPTTPRRKPHFDIPFSEYLEEELPLHQAVHKIRRSKTEPYHPQSCFRDPPVVILPNTPNVGGQWSNYFGYGQPLQQAYYPKTYQVY